MLLVWQQIAVNGLDNNCSAHASTRYVRLEGQFLYVWGNYHRNMAFSITIVTASVEQFAYSGVLEQLNSRACLLLDRE
jgi:hypothetical protein